MGRPLSVMAHHKRSIVEVRATDNCMAHALIIHIARLEKDSNYDSYRRGWKILSVVRNLLETTCIDLSRGEGIPELTRFQEQWCMKVYVAIKYSSKVESIPSNV